MGRFSNSVDLAKSSLGVLRSEKELAAIPVASAVTCGLIAVVVGGGAFLSLDKVANPAPGQNEFSATPLTWGVGIVGLFIIGLVSQFFAATLVAGANERLEGRDASIGGSLSIAMSRASSVLGWSVINSTVGLVLQAIRERAGFVGDLVVGLIGAAWNVVTWLVLPIIIIEGIGPVAAIRRSATMLKQTWGENLIAQLGFGLIGLLLLLPGLLIFGGLSFVIPFVGIPLLLVWVAIVLTIMSALSAIYRTALYRFAAGLSLGDAFDTAELQATFAVKTGRR